MTQFNEYYMLVALAVRERANCSGRKVGAVFVKNNRIISTGYNGTPEGMKNCTDGGCIRCSKHRNAGEFYDKCICVHAEQNALITSARFGTCAEGTVVYTTLQPCFTCVKELLQAKIKTIYYLSDLTNTPAENERDEDFDRQYNIIINRFEKIPSKIELKKIIKAHSNIVKYLKDLKNNVY